MSGGDEPNGELGWGQDAAFQAATVGATCNFVIDKMMVALAGGWSYMSLAGSIWTTASITLCLDANSASLTP